MATDHCIALVRRAVKEIWNEGDLAVADVLFSPTYINHGGLIPDLVCGPEAIKSGVALYRLAFPGLHITVDALGTEGEMQWTARRLPPATRPSVAHPPFRETLTGTLRTRCAGGQIAESWTQWDSGEVLRNLGLIQADAAPESDLATAGGQPDE